MSSLLGCVVAALLAPPVPLPEVPFVTATKAGTPGDPVNVVLVGSRAEVCAAFRAAGWSEADPITARSSVRIGVSVVLNRPYPAAPVSDLYLFGRTQDLAFELTVGGSARSRHHVRFWEAGHTPDGRPVWAGAGTFDVGVGRGPTTGRITHRIAPDVDTERDTILAALRAAGALEAGELWQRSGPTTGRNGGGDCYFTDGAVGVGVLRPVCVAEAVMIAPPARLLHRRR